MKTPKGRDATAPRPAALGPLDNSPFWMYLYIRIQDSHPALFFLSRPERRPHLVYAEAFILSR